MSRGRTFRVAIIGAGAGGIAAGVALQRTGEDITIYDSADGFGGTWRHNTYPGAACDVPSHLYSFSFAPNPRWSKTYADQPEILTYLEGVARQHELHKHLQPNTRVQQVEWSDESKHWTLTTTAGEQAVYDAVISAVGMLDLPNMPQIPDMNQFKGAIFHSARWDHTVKLSGQRVGSIGTGASAIQYVPAIASGVAELRVFQRTPVWVSPRHDVPFTEQQMQQFEAEPDTMRVLRDYIFNQYENADFDALGKQTDEATALARSYLRSKIADPDLREQLTPQYPVGCKRPLLSRDWLPTMALSHVHLVTTPITSFTERGLLTVDGQEHELDTVIYGTGFTAADYLASIEVVGTAGRSLRTEWAEGAEAYLGTTISGYPNFFTLFGPNTNGVNSILYIHEAQVAYISSYLDALRSTGAQALDVRAEVQRAYNQQLQKDLEGTVWQANCNNYYRHRSGKIVTQLPYKGSEFAARTRTLHLSDYELVEPAG